MPELPDRPVVSIILPTYNRAKFLPQAFASIRSQQFTDWELIVVDDGSTDNTRELVAELTRGWEQPVRYVYQENQGAYGARNTGLDLARGQYIAFFDSDDVWLPHHLADCHAVLANDQEIDWVYGPTRIVDFTNGRCVAENSFYQGGRPNPFLALRTRRSGKARAFDDPSTLLRMVSSGICCGLQTSLIRREVFHNLRFDTRHRNEAEDVLVIMRVMAAGRRFAYLDQVVTLYYTHDGNSSAADTSGSVEKKLRVFAGILMGFEDAVRELPLSSRERDALRRNLSKIYFWKVGYNLLWRTGRRAEALANFRRAIQLWSSNPAFWKTYLLAVVRTLWHKVWSGRLAGTTANGVLMEPSATRDR